MNDSESKVSRKKPGIFKLAKASQYNSWWRIITLFVILLGATYTAVDSYLQVFDRLKRVDEIKTYRKTAEEKVSRCYEVRNKLQEGGHLWLLVKDTKTGVTKTIDVNAHTFMSKEKGDKVWFSYSKRDLGEAGPVPKNIEPIEVWWDVVALLVILFIAGPILFEESSYDTRGKENRYEKTFKDKGYEIIPSFDYVVNPNMKKYFFKIPLLVLTIIGLSDLIITIIIEV